MVATTIAIAFLSRATGALGLQATVIPADRPSADAVLVSPSSLLTWQAAQRLIEAAGGGSLRMRWDGYLHVPASREYEIRVVSDAPVTLWIDGRVVFESPGSPDPPARILSLSAGPHLLGLSYGPVTRSSALDIQWDVGNRFRLASLPLEGLSPRPLADWKWRVRRYVPSAALAVTTAWSLAMLLAAWLWTWRAAARQLKTDWPLRLTLGALFALFVTGIWWGGIGGWQADAIDPESVRTAVLRGFGDGWYDKYPPLHYYLLGALYLPTIAADGLGWLTVHSEPVQLAMTLTGRLLTVVMALATTLAVAIVAARLTDDRHAWPAALLCGSFLPFAFYAKTTNVDLPFVCWFAWSLVFLVTLAGGTKVSPSTNVREAVFLGITAGAAVGTKDQAYGLYILPALLLLWRFGRSLAGWKVLASGALAATVTLLLIYNVLLNPNGLPLHLEFIQGPASTGYRMFEPSAAGQRDLLKSSAGQLLFAIGSAGALLILASIGSRHYSRSRFAFLVLAASIISYYLGFIAYAGYVYDRFLLPVTSVLAVFASIGARRLLDSGRARQIAGIVLLGWAAARAAATDVLLVRDSRVTAERWLAAHVKKNEVVAAVNQYGYIPRVFEFKRTWIQPSIDYTLAVNPEYVVLNREHSGRSAPGSDEQRWLAWLESGAGPYQEVFRYKASLAWTPLALDDRFSDRIQDPFTNLDKANPEIVIFRKTR
jgi:hypothetical protein